MALFDYLIAFVPMLGVLIFVHELGHFLVAKACGVRVLKFSLGFGSPIGFGRHRLHWERGGTEYVIAWIPLGGFVKMLGENLEIQGEEPPPEAIDARPDEYLDAKPTWQKLAIDFAGPAMNIAFPVLVFMGVLMVGLPRPAAVIGTVEHGSPAASAGLRPTDRLLSIDGEPLRFWNDVDEAIRAHSGGPVLLSVEREGSTFDVSVGVEGRTGLDELGDVLDVGWIGIGSRRLPALLGVPSSASLGAQAGLRSGDLVSSVEGAEVEDWEELRRAYAAASAATGEASEGADAGSVTVSVLRGDRTVDAEPEAVDIAVPRAGTLDALGVIAAAVLVHEVSPDSAAQEAGLEAGDLLLEVEGEPIGSFESFAERIRSSRGQPLALTYAREGAAYNVVVTPRLVKVANPYGIEGMEQELYRVGVAHMQPTLPGVMETERYLNPIVSLPRAIELTWAQTELFLRGLKKFVTGEVKSDQIAGPIGIAEIARKSLDMGWHMYLFTMVLISINLGILNLLPIPILDGGQALIHLVEGIKRSPISMRSRELVQSVGLAVLALLMGLAFWNDLSRNWIKFVEWLRSGV